MVQTLTPRYSLGRDVKNCFLAFYPDQTPIILFMDDHPFVCVYTSLRKLQENMEYVGIDGYDVKHIVDQADFFRSLEGHPVRVMLDPYNHMGRTRFTELFWK